MASSSSRPVPRTARSPEDFASLAQRSQAAEILQSYEKLSWYSFQRCETIAQTRMHFQCLVAGFTAEDEAERILWKEDFTRHPLKPGQESKSSRKGKERASLGGGYGSSSKESGSKGESSSKSKEKSKSSTSSERAKDVDATAAKEATGNNAKRGEDVAAE